MGEKKKPSKRSFDLIFCIKYFVLILYYFNLDFVLHCGMTKLYIKKLKKTATLDLEVHKAAKTTIYERVQNLSIKYDLVT